MPAEGDEMHAPLIHSHDPHAVALSCAGVLTRLREKVPRVHCITNTVAQNFTANVLLAAGAQPSMTIARDEVAAFAGGADALLVNLGTFDRERAEAIGLAIEAATSASRPWVLDPVLIDRSPLRAALARDLMTQGPSALRLNAAEFAALAGPSQSPETVGAFAAEHKVVVVVSGSVDCIADGQRTAALANGHVLMARITAMGCAASALVAGCLAVESDRWLASLAAAMMFGIAGEIAGKSARAPGSFAAAFLDALYALEPASLVERARLS
jgi:hydroxyethylthiazole kinase